MDRVILDLCGGTGEWSRPYHEAGYETIVVDPSASAPSRGPASIVYLTAEEFVELPSIPPVHGVLCAPPCTEFAVSGARWWEKKDPALLEGAIVTVRACLAIVKRVRPVWWALENPNGRIREFVPELGPPLLSFDPCDYGDGYTKRTHLWGRLKPPPFTARRGDAPLGSKMHNIPPGPMQKTIRSMTPPGFARAFFESNP